MAEVLRHQTIGCFRGALMGANTSHDATTGTGGTGDAAAVDWILQGFRVSEAWRRSDVCYGKPW